jgi:hypothetical protein
LCAKLHNAVISFCVGRRAGAKRSECPTLDRLETLNALSRQDACTVALSHVSDPCADRHIVSLVQLHMRGWHTGVTFTIGELDKGVEVGFPTVGVWDTGDFVHRRTLVRITMVCLPIYELFSGESRCEKKGESPVPLRGCGACGLVSK